MNETLAQAAARLTQELGGPITPRQVQLWRGKQYPVDDASALRACLLNQERVPKWLREASKKAAPTSAAKDIPTDSLSPEALDARLRELEGKLLATTGYEAARTIRTQIAALRDVFRIQADRKVYVLSADVRVAAHAAGNLSRAKWEKLAADLPPLLEGLTAIQMEAKLREYARARCVEMASMFAP
jgi:hypothetical protein